MHRQSYFNTRVMQSHETKFSVWILNKYRFKYIIEPVRVFVLNRILIGNPYNGQLIKKDIYKLPVFWNSIVNRL
jgi:hypothetical protein